MKNRPVEGESVRDAELVFLVLLSFNYERIDGELIVVSVVVNV